MSRAGALLVAVGLLWAVAPGCAEHPRPSHVILISLDTTRPDHLGLYGYVRDTSPNLDALAARGVVFEEMITTSENTLISHASIFTGLVPAAHGATHVGEGRALPPGARTLAEDFQAAGYQTAGFAAHGDWLTPAFGMDRGFDVFTSAYRDGEAVLADARKWLDGRDPERPFFLFIHLFDVHSDPGPRPYEAPEGIAGRFTSDYDGPFADWGSSRAKGSAFLHAVMDGHVELSDADLAYLRAQYDEGLYATDAMLGHFLDELGPRDRDLLDDAWVAVTADHGEEFLEHGRMLHSSFYDVVAKVPGILVPPGRDPEAIGPPRHVPNQVRVIDLRNTLLDLAGLPEAERSQGVSLAPWLRGEANRSPAGAATVYHQALRGSGFKLLRTKDGLRLYDLTNDPGEQHDLSADPEHADRVASMNARLGKMQKNDTKLGELLRADGEAPIPGGDRTANETLKALGYTR